MIDQMLQIKFPSEAVWSPDGRHIAFMWDKGGVHSLYVAGTRGQGHPLKLMSYPWNEVSGSISRNIKNSELRIGMSDTYSDCLWSTPGAERAKTE
jgi:hypothetical protein